MSGCPEKDLHSIYLDGEMPEKFIKEYETHVASCQECQKLQNKMRRISLLLKEDSLDSKLNQQFLEDSFKRLETKLNYSIHTDKKHVLQFSSFTKWTASLTAAAAVFAVVFAPIHLKTAPGSNQEIKAIARTAIKPVSENKVVIDGNLDSSKIASALSKGTEEASQQKTTASNQKVVPATSLASTGNSRIINEYPDIDVFRPDFNNSSASVRIEIPEIHSIPLKQAENFERR